MFFAISFSQSSLWSTPGNLSKCKGRAPLTYLGKRLTTWQPDRAAGQKPSTQGDTARKHNCSNKNKKREKEWTVPTRKAGGAAVTLLWIINLSLTLVEKVVSPANHSEQDETTHLELEMNVGFP